MGYTPIRAHRTPDPVKTRIVPCPRCGVGRNEPRKTSFLCQDCRSTMTPEEIEEWRPRSLMSHGQAA